MYRHALRGVRHSSEKALRTALNHEGQADAERQQGGGYHF